MATANDAQNNPPMEQILQTIRGVISGEEQSGQAQSDNNTDTNDDVLELTEMVGEDGSITSLKPGEATPPPVAENAATPPQTPDVLANIDNALNEEKAAPTAEDKPAQANSEKAAEPAPEKPAEATPPPTATEAVTPAGPAKETPTATPDTTTPTAFHAELSAQLEMPPEKNQLISEQAAKASTKALSAFIRNLPKRKIDTPSFQSGLTLEELVVEALKPELSAWLDKNLPVLVTHIVEKEIKKLLPQPDE